MTTDTNPHRLYAGEFYAEPPLDEQAYSRARALMGTSTADQDGALYRAIIGYLKGAALSSRDVQQPPPLDEDRIEDIWASVSPVDGADMDVHEFARAIERAHGIKEPT